MLLRIKTVIVCIRLVITSMLLILSNISLYKCVIKCGFFQEPLNEIDLLEGDIVQLPVLSYFCLQKSS